MRRASERAGNKRHDNKTDKQATKRNGIKSGRGGGVGVTSGMQASKVRMVVRLEVGDKGTRGVKE